MERRGRRGRALGELLGRAGDPGLEHFDEIRPRPVETQVALAFREGPRAAHERPCARLVPTWCLQAALLALFAGAYHYSTLVRWRRRVA